MLTKRSRPSVRAASRHSRKKATSASGEAFAAGLIGKMVIGP
jgi:hypothetical protein